MSRSKAVKLDKKEEEKGMEDLLSIILTITNREDLVAFLDDMLTDNEKKDIIQRLSLIHI